VNGLQTLDKRGVAGTVPFFHVSFLPTTPTVECKIDEW
jgi:hypothetical protein